MYPELRTPNPPVWAWELPAEGVPLVSIAGTTVRGIPFPAGGGGRTLSGVFQVGLVPLTKEGTPARLKMYIEYCALGSVKIGDEARLIMSYSATPIGNKLTASEVVDEIIVLPIRQWEDEDRVQMVEVEFAPHLLLDDTLVSISLFKRDPTDPYTETVTVIGTKLGWNCDEGEGVFLRGAGLSGALNLTGHARAHAMDDATDHTGVNLNVDTIKEKTATAGVSIWNAKGVGGAAGNAILFADKFADIAAAYAALPSSGGTIFVPSGTTININSVVAGVVITQYKWLTIIGQHSMKPVAGYTDASIINLQGAPAGNTYAFSWASTGAALGTPLTIQGVTFTATTANSNWYVVGENINIGMYNCNATGYKIKGIISVVYYSPRVIVQDCYFETWIRGISFNLQNVGDMMRVQNVWIIFPSSPNADAVGFYAYDNTYQGYVIKDCRVTNAGANRGGFEGRAGFVTYENCDAVNCRGYGFYAATGQFDYSHMVFKNCHAKGCYKHGFYASGSSGSSIVQVVWDGCYAKDCGTLGAGYSGFRVNSYCRMWIRGCRAYSAGTYHDNGIHFSSATGTTIQEFVHNDFDSGFKTVGGYAVRWYNAAQKAAVRDMDCVYISEAFDA